MSQTHKSALGSFLGEDPSLRVSLSIKTCHFLLFIRYHMRDIRFKLDRLALIIPFNYLIPKVFEKFAVVLSLGRFMVLLPFCADFILKLLKIFIELCASSPVQLMVFCNQVVTESFTLALQAHEFLVLFELLLLLVGQLSWRGCILGQTCITRQLKQSISCGSFHEGRLRVIPDLDVVCKGKTSLMAHDIITGMLI